jgi:hypothetical protein
MQELKSGSPRAGFGLRMKACLRARLVEDAFAGEDRSEWQTLVFHAERGCFRESEHLIAPHPPQLAIRSITADGRPPDSKSTFPPEIATLNVRYFAADFANPKNVIYGYQLDGADTSWQDVGSRSEAIYTHLKPGRYVFRVMASNSDGVWTEPVVSEPFTVPPRFYQKGWFAALGILAAVQLLWLAYAIRFRFVSREIRMRAEERADERIRIARELHDTLLQGVQGLLLTFHVAAEKVPADHESKKTLEKALATADQIILEGRNRFSFESGTGKGTEVRVILPARRAYVRNTGFWPLSARRGSI